MTVMFTIDILCDVPEEGRSRFCHVAVEVAQSSEPGTKRYARELAALEAGWVKMRDKDVCPACAHMLRQGS